jgi:8-oxo-dGTP diphosphatase
LREVKEETNLDLVGPLAHVYTTNALFPEAKKHYVTLFLRGEIRADSAPLQLMEPDKCVAWEWMAWEELRKRYAAGSLNVFNTLKPLLADDSFRL